MPLVSGFFGAKPMSRSGPVRAFGSNRSRPSSSLLSGLNRQFLDGFSEGQAGASYEQDDSLDRCAAPPTSPNQFRGYRRLHGGIQAWNCGRCKAIAAVGVALPSARYDDTRQQLIEQALRAHSEKACGRSSRLGGLCDCPELLPKRIHQGRSQGRLEPPFLAHREKVDGHQRFD